MTRDDIVNQIADEFMAKRSVEEAGNFAVAAVAELKKAEDALSPLLLDFNDLVLQSFDGQERLASCDKKGAGEVFAAVASKAERLQVKIAEAATPLTAAVDLVNVYAEAGVKIFEQYKALETPASTLELDAFEKSLTTLFSRYTASMLTSSATDVSQQRLETMVVQTQNNLKLAR